jgi:hypothetical protein
MILMNNCIGLSGWAKSGKDTIANYLVENHGYRRISFADPMREALLRLDPLVPYMGLYMRLSGVIHFRGWDSAKRDVPEIRELLQRFGTEVGREMFGENFWVNAAISTIQPGEKIVFADVRYKNEADAIKALGGAVIRVTRAGVVAVNDHTSERDLDDYKFDLSIDNSGSLEDLWSLVASHVS